MNAAHAVFHPEGRGLDDGRDPGRRQAQLESPRVDIGEIQNVIDRRKQCFRRARDSREILLLLVVQFADTRAGKQLGEADDARERGAQLIGDVTDELALEPVGGHKRLVAFLERAGVPLRDRDVGKADERAAIGQRQRSIVDHAQISPGHLALCMLALVRERRRRLSDVVPFGGVVMEDLALTNDLVDVRLVLERASTELPDAFEGVIEELQTAVRAEHGNAFIEMVERLALNADHLIVAARERYAFGFVLIEVRDTAIGTFLGHHMQRAAIGKMPPLLGLRTSLVAGENLGFPFAIVHDLGDAASLAQAIEKLAMHRALAQPVCIELPELGEGLVEEAEPLVAREDGDGSRDAVECAIEGGDEAVEFAFRALDGRDVDGASDARLAEREHHDVVMTALATDDQWHALAEALLAHEHVREFLALTGLEQLELAIGDIVLTLRADCAHVGLVDPFDLAAAAPDPHWMGQRIVKRATEADVARELAVLRDDLRDLLAIAGNIPEAQDGAAAGNASISFDVAAGACAQEQIERLALREERVEFSLEIAGRLGFEPRAKAHEKLGIFRQARHRRERVRGDAHVLALLPEDEDLRLGLDDRFGSGEAAAQFDDLVAALPEPPALLKPGAPDQCDHGGCGAHEHGAGEQRAEPEAADDLNAGVERRNGEHGDGGDRRHQQQDQILPREPPFTCAFCRVHAIPGAAMARRALV